MPSLPSSRGCRNHCRIHQSIFPCQEAFRWISSCYHLCRCRSIQQTTTPVDARRRLNPSHHCSMEVRNKVGTHSCLLPDTSLQSFHDVLWRCHPFSQHQSVYKISHGNAWLRDSVRRIDVSSWIVKLQAHTETGTCLRDSRYVAKANITPDEEFKTEMHSLKREAG